MVYRFDIEKQYWERYPILWIKLYQYKQYEINRTIKYEMGKYDIGKDKMSEYWYLATFEKSYQCCYVSSQEISY